MSVKKIKRFAGNFHRYDVDISKNSYVQELCHQIGTSVITNNKENAI